MDETLSASDGATVLIVEDEPDLLHLMEHNLERSGLRVVTATSMAAAESKLQSEAVNLIILDIMLPDGSGLNLCRKIRKTIASSEIPIVLVTASLLPSDREEGLAAGACDYVTKPFAVSELVETVKKHLKQSEGPTGDETDESQLTLLPELGSGKK